MNRRFCVLGSAFIALAGCADLPTHLQEAEESKHEKPKEVQIKTIGDCFSFSNADPIPISGVGLVVGLEGTGGAAPQGTYRSFLEKKLSRDRVEHIQEILASPDASLVLVSAMLPPGAHVGDSVDVEVTLPPQSKTTSLRGGYLKACELYNYDSTKHLDPSFQGANRTLIGHVLAQAEGPLVVGMDPGDEAGNLKRGRVWDGGRSKVERSFYILMNSDQQRGAVVQQIALRINETFQGQYHGAATPLAVAKTTSYLVLGVPHHYRLNLPRYLRVVRLIPFEGVPPESGPYRLWLKEALLDPAHTVTAALRLEALGGDAIPTLKLGLDSNHPVVRFASAEALAYLDCPACGEELAKVVQQQPLLRAYALTALASMDEAVSHVKLHELLASPVAESRYGAFRALRALDEREPAVAGELLNDSFWLHRAAPNSPPLVHLSTSRRAELVLFGERPSLRPPFYFLAGEFTVTASPNDERCTISRQSAEHGSSRRQCDLALETVLHCLADMGAAYGDVVGLLRQAGDYECLSCPLAVDALPQAISVVDLAQKGADDPELLQADQAVRDTHEELGTMPTPQEQQSPASDSPADTGSDAKRSADPPAKTAQNHDTP
jgi:hypothetical protein